MKTYRDSGEECSIMSEYLRWVVGWGWLLQGWNGKVGSSWIKAKVVGGGGKGLVVGALCIGLWGCGAIVEDEKKVSASGKGERWECGWLRSSTRTVIAEGELEKGKGVLVVDGVRKSARFGVVGFDRRWSFGRNSEYLFLIGANRRGRYYDLSDLEVGEKVGPSQIFSCERTKAW